MINFVTRLEQLRIPPGNRLEKLSGDLAGFYSIRINDQFQIIFKWINDHAYEVQLIDYH
jgi:proteic killer suppression protein